MAINDSTTENTYFRKGPTDAGSILSGLFEAAADHLSRADLQRLAEASEEAVCMLSHLGETLTGIGCLVGNDKDLPEGVGKAGNFWSGGSDLPTLLFSTAQIINTAIGLIKIGDDAAYRLTHEYTSRRA